MFFDCFHSCSDVFSFFGKIWPSIDNLLLREIATFTCSWVEIYDVTQVHNDDYLKQLCLWPMRNRSMFQMIVSESQLACCDVTRIAIIFFNSFKVWYWFDIIDEPIIGRSLVATAASLIRFHAFVVFSTTDQWRRAGFFGACKRKVEWRIRNDSSN